MVTERELQRTIVDAARWLGWMVYFTQRSDHSPAGFPDLFCTKGDRALALELKSAKGKPTGSQLAWLAALRTAGIDARLVFPSDLDTILEVLAA